MAGLLSGYSSTIRRGIQKRYTEKLGLVDGIDPYEVAKGIWQDDMDPSSESLLRKRLPQSQKPGLLPEFCARLGEASAHETCL